MMNLDAADGIYPVPTPLHSFVGMRYTASVNQVSYLSERKEQKTSNQNQRISS
jgi:hypothetical protein